MKLFMFDGKQYTSLREYGKAIVDKHRPGTDTTNWVACDYAKMFVKELGGAAPHDLAKKKDINAMYHFYCEYNIIALAPRESTHRLLDLYCELKPKGSAMTLREKCLCESIYLYLDGIRKSK